MLRNKEINLLVNYQQWLKIFEEITRNNTLKENYPKLIKGKLKDYKYSINYFNKELVKFINNYLKFLIDNYIKTINDLLNNGDVNSARYLTVTFFKTLKMIIFYNYLKFLDVKIKKDLNMEIKRNIIEFSEHFKHYLYLNSGFNQFFCELSYIINRSMEEYNGLL